MNTEALTGVWHSHIKGLIGYVVDLWRMAKFDFTNPHSYTKCLIINKTRRKSRSTTLIEVGTYRGVTAGRCSAFFERVYTIELDTRLAQRAVRYLADKRNVKVIQGDGVDCLPRLLADEGIDNVLIFLDGHFSGGDTACGVVPEPALQELKMLSRYKEKINAIVIDDFRCFGTKYSYPKKSDLLESAEEFAKDVFEITVHLDQLVIMRRRKQ